MSQKEKFEFSHEVASAEAAGYLEELSKCLKDGRVALRHAGDSLALDLTDSVALEIHAKRKPNKASLSIELTWRTEPAHENGSEPETEEPDAAAAEEGLSVGGAAETPAPAMEEPDDEIGNMSRDELYARASELNIQGRSSMNRDQLLEALRVNGK